VVPAHARVASDSVFLHVARWPFGCNSTAALGSAQQWPFWCGGACPSVPSLQRSSLQWFFDTCFERVELRFCFVFLSSLSVEFWPR
jgi:hypothetical protein